MITCFLSILAQYSFGQPWQVIRIDSTREAWNRPPFEWLRGFGIDAQDVNHDGMKDIVAGWYFYINPGGDMTGAWKRYDLQPKADGLMFVNIDDDDKADFIATTLPHVYWFEYTGDDAQPFNVKEIGTIPATDHINGQGYLIADVFKGGKPEILLKAGDGVYAAAIPANPNKDSFHFIRIAATHSNEGFDAADIDGDGLLDIISGEADDTAHADIGRSLYWYKNPGNESADWQRYFIGNTNLSIDRIRVGRFYKSKIPQIVATEEEVTKKEAIAKIWLFENKGSNARTGWKGRVLGTHYSLNNLDVGDINGDGRLDILTSEHKGPLHRFYYYQNLGNGKFKELITLKGVEMHLGDKLEDIDGDGDLDIIGPSWDNTGNLHVIVNQRILGK